MKMSFQSKNHTVVLIIGLFVATILTACSGDNSNDAEVRFDHTHGSDVSNLKKHAFEHQFADQCVEREVRNSVNKEEDRKRFAKPCLCIATRMMRNLTEVEAKKFLVEKKSTHSLKMSFDEAAYFCLQKHTKAKSPVIFGKR